MMGQLGFAACVIIGVSLFLVAFVMYLLFDRHGATAKEWWRTIMLAVLGICLVAMSLFNSPYSVVNKESLHECTCCENPINNHYIH